MTSLPAGFRTAVACLGVALLASQGCKLSDVSRDGPAPSITGAARGDAGFPAEAVVCTDLTSTVTLTGSFSPMPKNILSGAQGVVLPSVTAIDSSGGRHELGGVTYDQDHGTLAFVVDPQQLAPDTYGIEVKNPNGKSTTLASGLVVVAPPTLASIDPAFGYSSSTTDVTLTGDGFREAVDGTQPTITLTPETATTTAQMISVAVASATQTAATVPAGLAVDFYAVTLTNPEGCSATLTHAFEVRPPPVIDLCNAVTPHFGWSGGSTTIEICADNSGGHGLQPVPQVYLLIPDADGHVNDVPLVREEMLSAHTARGGFTDASVMSAVVDKARSPGIAEGGPYAIKVVNPDGSVGVIPSAFWVIHDPPPTIASVSPEQGTTQQATDLTIVGKNLRDATAGVDLARILLLTSDLAPGADCLSTSGCYVCAAQGAPVEDANGVDTVVCTAPSTTMSAGGYVVRYENTDEWHASGDYASFTVTNPSTNISNTVVAMPALVTGRWGLAAALGRDDLGTRFAYAIGGLTGTGMDSALDTVEVASLTSFGELGQWTTIRSKLPAARSGLVAFAHGRYVFAAGGRDTAGAPQTTVWRARILGSDTAPVLSVPEPAPDTSSTLAAGTYLYRVSAIMGATGDNPGGETLASDSESVAVSQGQHVRLTWAPIDGATYRVYRSPRNGFATTERLIADGLATAELVDAGASVLDDTVAPLPAGALGTWVEMTGSPLAVARADASATIAVPSGATTPYVYVTAGATDSGGTLTNTIDYAAIQETSGVVSLGTFSTSTPTGSAPAARAEHIAVTVDAVDTPKLTSGKSYLMIAMGTDGTAARDDIYITTIASDGSLGDWTQASANSNGSGSGKRQGTLASLMNNQLVVFGGKSGNTYPTGGISAGCGATPGDPPIFGWGGQGALSATLSSGRYRGAMLYAGGMFFAIGGRNADTGASSVNATVDRLSY